MAEPTSTTTFRISKSAKSALNRIVKNYQDIHGVKVNKAAIINLAILRMEHAYESSIKENEIKKGAQPK